MVRAKAASAWLGGPGRGRSSLAGWSGARPPLFGWVVRGQAAPAWLGGPGRGRLCLAGWSGETPPLFGWVVRGQAAPAWLGGPGRGHLCLAGWFGDRPLQLGWVVRGETASVRLGGPGTGRSSLAGWSRATPLPLSWVVTMQPFNGHCDGKWLRVRHPLPAGRKPCLQGLLANQITGSSGPDTDTRNGGRCWDYSQYLPKMNLGSKYSGNLGCCWGKAGRPWLGVDFSARVAFVPNWVFLPLSLAASPSGIHTCCWLNPNSGGNRPFNGYLLAILGPQFAQYLMPHPLLAPDFMPVLPACAGCKILLFVSPLWVCLH
ncbi:uncharacterized protein LOC119967182 [Scyliorhinus canicula]|uniref:uncharacterized protein LOC119967182 n=1 Tax=Scyliorhinus canicula TaxID=7830 RepID=UPI0018F79369|nr:uncharacterized protein LOC119967182 [Scyliorhinus canicula]